VAFDTRCTLLHVLQVTNGFVRPAPLQRVERQLHVMERFARVVYHGVPLNSASLFQMFSLA
jgi:hypothetical protein